MQRFLFLCLLIISCIAAIHNPKRWGNWLYVSFLSIISLIGVGVATRQIWLQHLPMSERPMCAPGVEFIFNHYLWQEILPLFFTGSGDCGEIVWQLFGLSMPVWSLLLFGAILSVSVALLFFTSLKRQKGG